MLAVALLAVARASAMPALESTELRDTVERSKRAMASSELLGISARVSAAVSQLGPRVDGNPRATGGRLRVSRLGLAATDARGHVQTYVYVRGDVDRRARLLVELGARVEIVDREAGALQAWLPGHRISTIARLPWVRRIAAPSYAVYRKGRRTTRGDRILRARSLRSSAPELKKGAGVTVGVISDGMHGAKSARRTGDLPARVRRVVRRKCQPRRPDPTSCNRGITCSEGTAMLEIVHDVAPRAKLAFAPVRTSMEFRQAVRRLSAKAEVVVDDLGFLLEPYFGSGGLGRSIDKHRSSAVFVSAAGNLGAGHYEGRFRSKRGLGLDLHDFGRAAGRRSDTAIGVRVPAGEYVLVVLQWNDSFEAPANDYDLFLTNRSGSRLLCPTCFSAFPQSARAGQFPIEALCYHNDGARPLTAAIRINRFGGESRVLKVVVMGSRMRATYRVRKGSLIGHPGAASAIAVGAIAASDPGHDTIEPYSSRGPVWTSSDLEQQRLKPDVVAIDGVAVTGAGGFPKRFYGTSAAAPHVAGIAALLLASHPRPSFERVRAALREGAHDLGPRGPDPTFGWGRVDARQAYRVLIRGARNRSVEQTVRR